MHIIFVQTFSGTSTSILYLFLYYLDAPHIHWYFPSLPCSGRAGDTPGSFTHLQLRLSHRWPCGHHPTVSEGMKPSLQKVMKSQRGYILQSVRMNPLAARCSLCCWHPEWQYHALWFPTLLWLLLQQGLHLNVSCSQDGKKPLSFLKCVLLQTFLMFKICFFPLHLWLSWK